MERPKPQTRRKIPATATSSTAIPTNTQLRYYEDLKNALTFYNGVKSGELSDEVHKLGPNAKHIAHGAIQALNDTLRSLVHHFPELAKVAV